MMYKRISNARKEVLKSYNIKKISVKKNGNILLEINLVKTLLHNVCLWLVFSCKKN